MNYATKDQLIAFENRIKGLWEAGDLPFLLHLCGGNEDQLIEIFAGIQEGDWIFSSHRNHYHALLAGIEPAKLEALIRSGHSMFVFDRTRNFVTSSILAGTCGIAAGVAWQLKHSGSSNRVWCFLGDGAEEEGHLYEAALFVAGQELPCTFVIEDNNRQVDTDKATRRAAQLTNPLDSLPCVRRYHYTAVYPHAGSGCKHQITFNPAIVKQFA
ncbi:MAG: thiamine pyrophosphate-dependent enzyme [Alphaproteobacteria bacterium]